MNTRPLNQRELGFIEDYMNEENKELFHNGTRCALKWFNIIDENNVNKENTAASIATEYLRKPHIKAYMEERENNIIEILNKNKGKLIKAAIEQGIGGSAAVLNNLINKLLPTLNANENNNTNVDPDEYLTNLVNNLVKQDKVADSPADDNKPLVKSSNNNNLENN